MPIAIYKAFPVSAFFVLITVCNSHTYIIVRQGNNYDYMYNEKY